MCERMEGEKEGGRKRRRGVREAKKRGKGGEHLKGGMEVGREGQRKRTEDRNEGRRRKKLK